MKVFNTSFTLSTEERCEVSDITKLVREVIQQSPVVNGIALINTLHTTSRPSSSGSSPNGVATVTTTPATRTASAATPARTCGQRCSVGASRSA